MPLTTEKNLIKKLQLSIPRGRLFSSKELRKLGISSALAHYYLNANWLVRLGRGTFMFAGDTLQRDPSIKFLEQKIPDLHVAGKTALSWQGFLHNITYRETINLWGKKNTTLPAWFKKHFSARYTAIHLFDSSLPKNFELISLPEVSYGPLISSPARALLEMLAEVGTHQDIEEAKNIMESMSSILTAELTVLLKCCTLIKVTRLCVLWAEELGLPWAKSARKAAAHKLGTSRWVKRLANGHTLTLKA